MGWGVVLFFKVTVVSALHKHMSKGAGLRSWGRSPRSPMGTADLEEQGG